MSAADSQRRAGHVVRWQIVVILLAWIALTLAAALLLFSAFMLYDDEGYVLLSLKNFVEHGELYRTVYTQYGPLPYALYWVLHGCGAPISHNTGRLIAVGSWSLAALASTGLVWRATRNLPTAVLTLAATFAYLWVMISEPAHPGGLIVAITALAAVGGYVFLAQGHATKWALCAGASAAASSLTKINVGAFAVLTTFGLAALLAQDRRVRRTAPWVVGVLFGALPLLLMRTLFAAPWVQTYALAYSLGALTTVGAVALASRPADSIRVTARALIAGLAGGVIVAAGVLLVVMPRGTSFAELLDGMLLAPLRHPASFSLSHKWSPGARAVAIVSAMAFVLAAASASRFRAQIDFAVAAGRMLVAGGGIWVMMRFPQFSPDYYVFGYGLAAFWVLVWPLAGEPAARLAPRSWLALLLLGQWLHAYPVPGSQIAWGTFLVLPLIAISGHDAWMWLRERATMNVLRSRAVAVVASIALVAVATRVAIHMGVIGQRYFSSRSLALRGAEAVRLPDATTALFRILTFNASVHADVLFSEPGMFSLNLWSEVPTPSLQNVTHWFSLFDDSRQRAIVSALAASPRACVVFHREHVDYLRRRGLAPRGPLHDYIEREFAPAMVIDHFEFRIRRGREIAPFFTAELGQRVAEVTDGGDTLLRMPVLLAPGLRIGSIMIMETERQTPFLILDARNSRLGVTPIDLHGRAVGAAQAAEFPLRVDGPVELAVSFDRGQTPFNQARTVLVLRDPAGLELALVRLRD